MIRVYKNTDLNFPIHKIVEVKDGNSLIVRFFTTNEYNYILGKIAISDSIITLLTTLFYFGILQYFLKGQTIGKKILKLNIN